MNNFRVLNVKKKKNTTANMEASRNFLLQGLWGSDLRRSIMELVQKHSKHMTFTLNLAFKCITDITLQEKSSPKANEPSEGKGLSLYHLIPRPIH